MYALLAFLSRIKPTSTTTCGHLPDRLHRRDCIAGGQDETPGQSANERYGDLSTEIARREANQLGRPAQQMIAVVDRKKRASRLLELIFYLLSSLGTPGAALPQSCFQKENIPRPCHVNSANGPWMRRGIRRKLKGWAFSTFRRCVERRSS
jgi:hypothetical protein